MTTQAPKSIGPYKIESLLEKGSTSFLYLATHPETQEPIAVKALTSKYVGDPDAVSRFLNEAEIIAITNHPNIVKLYGYGEWKGGLYIAMEFIQGVSLRQYILQNPISLKRALRFTLDIAYALCHLHTHGVIHRDLTTENILINQNNEVKVIDFGIAQLLTEKQKNGEEPRFMGTPIYMSPEQQQHPENVTFASDIYSLGIIAYELILGKLSHGKIHLSLMPRGMHQILSKTLQPNPKDRYQDIVDFISDVSAYVNSSHFQKERKAGDQLSELSEEFQQSKKRLMPPAPNWPDYEIGLTTYQGLQVAGTFHDFFTLPNGDYGLVMGHPSATGAAATLDAAHLTGMLHGIFTYETDLEKALKRVNEHLCSQEHSSPIPLHFLLLSPKKKQFHYLSCGIGTLWVIHTERIEPIHCDHSPLGTDPEAPLQARTTPFTPHMKWVLHNLPKPPSEQSFKQLLEHHGDSPPQKFTDLLLRRLTITHSPSAPLSPTMIYISST